MVTGLTGLTGPASGGVSKISRQATRSVPAAGGLHGLARSRHRGERHRPRARMTRAMTIGVGGQCHRSLETGRTAERPGIEKEANHGASAEDAGGHRVPRVAPAYSPGTSIIPWRLSPRTLHRRRQGKHLSGPHRPRSTSALKAFLRAIHLFRRRRRSPDCPALVKIRIPSASSHHDNRYRLAGGSRGAQCAATAVAPNGRHLLHGTSRSLNSLKRWLGR